MLHCLARPLLFQCIIDGAQKWKSQKSGSNVPQQGSKAVGLYRLAEPSQPGLLPTAKGVAQVRGSFGMCSRNFSFLSLSMQKRTGKVERSSTSDFFRLIPHLVLALEQRWLVYIQFVMKNTFVMLLEEFISEKDLESWPDWLLRLANDSQIMKARFLKSKVCIRNELNLDY